MSFFKVYIILIYLLHIAKAILLFLSSVAFRLIFIINNIPLLGLQ